MLAYPVISLSFLHILLSPIMHVGLYAYFDYFFQKLQNCDHSKPLGQTPGKVTFIKDFLVTSFPATKSGTSRLAEDYVKEA